MRSLLARKQTATPSWEEPVQHATPTFLYAEYEGAVSLVESYLVDPYDEVRFLSIGGPEKPSRPCWQRRSSKGTS